MYKICGVTKVFRRNFTKNHDNTTQAFSFIHQTQLQLANDDSVYI